MQVQHSPDRTKGGEEEVAGSTRARSGGHEESESLAGMIVPRGETVFGPLLYSKTEVLQLRTSNCLIDFK